jgi:hypothetical protein
MILGRLAISAILWTALSTGLAAQTPDTASVRGSVVDQTGAGIADALVAVRNLTTGLERTVLTNADGRFVIAGLPIAGTYEITASRQGFASAHLGDVTFVGGTSAELRLQLHVTGGETRITVTGVSGEVRGDEPQLGVRLGARQIVETPLLGNKITYLPLLNAANRPALNQGDVFMNQNLFTTNGAGRRQTWFEVDGSSGNDSWGRQTIFSTIPVLAVEEMKILTSAFSAEYGGNTGSVVNIITRSGGNRFHAELMELWRPSSTTADLSGFNAATATSGNQITEDSLGQTALSVSGPIGRARGTQFFASGEYSRQNRTSPVTSPVAPGAFVGHYRGWLAFLRVDHQINERNNLFWRNDVDSFYDTNPNGTVGGNNLPSVDRVFRRRTYSTELGETAVLSPALVNSMRLQFQLGSPITQFDPVIYGTQYQVPISAGGVFTTGTSQSALLLNHQYQISEVLSGAWGRHQIKFGGDAIYSHNGGNGKEFGGPIYLGQFVYNTCTQSLSVCESDTYLNDIRNVRSYTQSYGNAAYTVNDTRWALFVQDDYKVRSDLTLNLGLRYEQQTFTDSVKDFAPRIGFAYNLRGDGRTVVRSGFGIYHSQIVDNAAANYALTGPTGVFNYTATPGMVGFPSSVAAAPLPVFPEGATMPLRSLYLRPGKAAYYDQFFPTSTLTGYPDALLNPYSEQWSFGVERRLKPDWVLSLDYLGSHTIRINRPLDVNPPVSFIRTAQGQTRTAQEANCTRPYWIWWYGQSGTACNPGVAGTPRPPYALILSDVNDGFSSYAAMDANLTHRFSRGFSLLASYTWSHAIDNVDPDVPSQNPNDPNFTGRQEKGNAIFDQRHRFVLSGIYSAPLRINFGGVITLASGLPYNFVTGTNNSGDTGATSDRPVIDGVVVARNAGRGRPVYDVSPFVERPFVFGNDRAKLVLRAESFNVFNHANFVGYSGTFGNGPVPGSGFGQPLTGITNQLPSRSLQFSVTLAF